MKIKGVVSGMAIHYAHCCHPLPGESELLELLLLEKGLLSML